MVKIESPFSEIRRREQEWDFFQIPYSLREKLERADSIESCRYQHGQIQKASEDYKRWREWVDKQPMDLIGGTCAA